MDRSQGGRGPGRRGWGPAVLAALISLAAAAPALAQDGGYLRTFTLIGADGARIARAVTSAPACPDVVVDGVTHPMAVRSPMETVAQRPTVSDPSDSKPSVFAVTTCEALVPAHARRATIAGRRLPLPSALIRRIVVIGDTGCRVKKSDGAFQACKDPRAYPFAEVAAAAAAWKPDLVVHVGDFLYRETACPPSQAACADTPLGLRLGRLAGGLPRSRRALDGGRAPGPGARQPRDL